MKFMRKKRFFLHPLENPAKENETTSYFSWNSNFEDFFDVMTHFRETGHQLKVLNKKTPNSWHIHHFATNVKLFFLLLISPVSFTSTEYEPTQTSRYSTNQQQSLEISAVSIISSLRAVQLTTPGNSRCRLGCTVFSPVHGTSIVEIAGTYFVNS